MSKDTSWYDSAETEIRYAPTSLYLPSQAAGVSEKKRPSLVPLNERVPLLPGVLSSSLMIDDDYILGSA